MALTTDETAALVSARYEDRMRAERGTLLAAYQAIELAYGLLWAVGCDRSTPNGQALYLARKALFGRLDKDGQARGITAAREALEAQPPLTTRLDLATFLLTIYTSVAMLRP